MKREDRLELEVQGLTPEGDGLAQHQGRAVSVAFAFPGERVEARVLDVSRQHPRARAQVVSVRSAHPARRTAACTSHVAHGGSCTGCPLMELDEAAQREAKRAMLKDQFGLEVAEVEGTADGLGYRYSAKRVAFGAKGRLRLGSFMRGSHRAAPMWNCLVDHPRITAAFAELSLRATELGIVAYDEQSGAGDLRYVWAKTDGERAILTLITADSESRAARELPPLLPSAAGVLHSVQGARSNVMRGTEPTLLCGRAELELELLGERVVAGALGFLQPNPQVASLAYSALLDVPPASLVLDLYAGSGFTNRVLRRRCEQVLPCEQYPESARELGVAPSDVSDFIDNFAKAHPGRAPDLVVANPPRQGLGERVCGQLVALGAPYLHIMSCGPGGLSRDLRALGARYELVALRAFDTLPQTAHVELVAKLALREAPQESQL